VRTARAARRAEGGSSTSTSSTSTSSTSTRRRRSCSSRSCSFCRCSTTSSWFSSSRQLGRRQARCWATRAVPSQWVHHRHLLLPHLLALPYQVSSTHSSATHSSAGGGYGSRLRAQCLRLCRAQKSVQVGLRAQFLRLCRAQKSVQVPVVVLASVTGRLSQNLRGQFN
jgi:hypothetical protein